VLLTKILAGVVGGAFDRDNDTIGRATNVTTPVLLSFLTNEVTQLFTIIPDRRGFGTFTSTGCIVNNEIDFAS
jgi:hypothetical protein